MLSFNPQQKEIIKNIKGAYLVAAPVGTGKTTVLAERVIRALEEGINPEEILCLTFTNRAAEEMKERIRRKLTRADFDSLVINTIHGFCAYFLKAEAKNLDLSNDFIIWDEGEQVEKIKNLLEQASFNTKELDLRKLIDDKLYKSRLQSIYKKGGIKINKEIKLDGRLRSVFEEYLKIMEEENAIDFNQLVSRTLEALLLDKRIRKKWSKRFRLIQLDEFQDTHLPEYLIIKELAREHKNIALIGDLDQTIYAWRGSQPYFIVKLFKKHFNPVKELALEINYRFSPSILSALHSVLANFQSQTKRITSGLPKTKQEKCISVMGAYNFSEEISWVIENIKKIRKEDERARIAVLARAHWQIKEAACIFREKNISHITVDQYNFFRRQEVKDIYAYLKILFNKFDIESALRLIKTPPKNIGPETINKIQSEGKKIGLKLSDFLVFSNYRFPEPFFYLIENWEKGRIIVLDTETTGTNPRRDNIVQIYAREIVNGQTGKEFHYYLKSEIPVGYSEEIHGLSDEFLAEHGHDPQKILKELKEFIGESPIAGHNINFDLGMIRENGHRRGIDFSFKYYYDTLDISRRLIESENYKLSTLARNLGFASATHSADDDVAATIDLLGFLVKILSKTQKQRTDLFTLLRPKFISLAQSIDSWQRVARKKRPPELLRVILKESGLEEHYSQNEKKEQRLKSFEILEKLFKDKDNKNEEPASALEDLIQYAALVKNIDFLGLEKGKIPIVTVHQVKGLEFDYIFIINLNERSFPARWNNDLEEEKRLFYVALTRARKEIFLSYSRFDDFGRPLAPSRFISFIDEKYITHST